MTEEIWKEKDIKEKGKIYNEYFDGSRDDSSDDSSKENGFSWVLKKDAKVLNLKKEKIDSSDPDKEKTRKLNLNIDKTSVNLGIPSQVHGDVEDAEFFLCLLNPRVQNNKELKAEENTLKGENMSIKDYTSIEDKNGDEYFKDPNKYISHIYDKDNILFEEITRVLGNDEKTKKEKLKHLKTEDLYYLANYFLYIYELEGSRRIDKEKKFLKKDNLDVLNLKICNLELFPYRTESAPKAGIFKKGKSYEDLASSQYVANLILDRIDKEESKKKSDKKLFFVFRSYKNWFNVIENELGKRKAKEEGKGTEPKDVEAYIKDNEENILKEFEDKYWKYFFVFSSSQNAGLSRGNLRRAPKIGPKISDSEYKNIKAIFNAQ